MISVIIPIFNEFKTLPEILKRVKALPFLKEIILVDDFSTDGTRDILRNIAEENVQIYFHEHNMGKGAAIRTALEHVAGDVVVIQDADLEYRPEELPRLINIIEKDEAEVVYGSRFLGVHEKKYWNPLYLGNRFLTFITALFFGKKVTDMETCYKAFKTEIIKSFKLRANRFDFEPEVTAKVLKGGYRFVEIPISYQARSYSEGKKIGWKDGVMAILTLLKYRFIS